MGLELEIDVPESRQVTLPASVPVGKVVVSVRARADDAPDGSSEAYRRERAAFLALLPQLLTTHRGRFVAVHGGRVVAEGTDDATVTAEAYARVGYTDLYVGEVTESPRVVRMPSFRVLRGGGA